MKFSKLVFRNINSVNFENIIIENLHLKCMKNLSVRFRSSLNKICLEWVDWSSDKVSSKSVVWRIEILIFIFSHNNYSENTNFEFFIGKSIHLYIHNHFTTYYSARASWCAVIRPVHPMDHECKAAHKFQHFKILVDFQGFPIQTCPENTVDQSR